MSLSNNERQFFRDADPLGFILFARNCETPDQVMALVSVLRDSVGRDDAPVLIDQEGGRVQRLRPPHWRDAPSAKVFADLYARDQPGAREATFLNALLVARDLAALGITVDCAPVLDVPQPDAHGIIGDRAHGHSPPAVAALGRAVCEGLLAGGILPVIKHVPGHGRARADSHVELPVVSALRVELEQTDFPPFSELADQPWAMTAHVVYTALDDNQPATTSAVVIKDIIREQMGFDGVLVSDDIGMKALDGDFGDRTRRALAAGCDVVLHCSGDLDEMIAVAEEAGALTDIALRRVARAETLRQTTKRSEMSGDAALEQLQALLA